MAGELEIQEKRVGRSIEGCIPGMMGTLFRRGILHMCRRFLYNYLERQGRRNREGRECEP